MTPREIDGDVSSGQKHSAASGGSARKGGEQRPLESVLAMLRPRASAKDVTGAWGGGGGGCSPSTHLDFLTPAPGPMLSLLAGTPRQFKIELAMSQETFPWVRRAHSSCNCSRLEALRCCQKTIRGSTLTPTFSQELPSPPSIAFNSIFWLSGYISVPDTNKALE